MLHRLVLLILIAFWLVMNTLLWRSEFGGKVEPGNGVPVGVVWQKILTAPDDSGLAVLQEGKRIGFLRWAPNVGEEKATGKTGTEEIEGMVKVLANYRVELGGDVMLGTPPIRLHINAASMFGTNLMWRDVSARAAIRPVAWLLHADAAKKNVELRYDEETNAVWRRTLTFDQLRNPQTLLAELGDPALLALAGPLMQLPVAPRGKEGKFSFASLWEARHDWLRIGRTQVRVYHLQARLPNRAKVEIVVSRVGEILRVELPGGVTLVNEALENW